jgi:hypothetical protein
MALLGSKRHTEGDTTRWNVNYAHWLEKDGANIEQIDVQSSSVTCTIADITVLGPDVYFYLVGGTLNERLIVSLTMTDNIGNIKNDTISFTVVAA